MAIEAGARSAPNEPGRGSFTISDWSAGLTASLEARGPDLIAALAAGLGAILALGPAAAPAARQTADRSTPLRGEGDDEAALFADLVTDLIDQIALYGASIDTVRIDGVLRRDEGGFVAWGYAEGPLAYAPVFSPLRLDGPAGFTRDAQGTLVLTATLRRS